MCPCFKLTHLIPSSSHKYLNLRLPLRYYDSALPVASATPAYGTFILQLTNQQTVRRSTALSVNLAMFLHTICMRVLLQCTIALLNFVRNAISYLNEHDVPPPSVKRPSKNEIAILQFYATALTSYKSTLFGQFLSLTLKPLPLLTVLQ